ncbi:hypothetical protein Tco_1034715 [Tanacetum coccineum]
MRRRRTKMLDTISEDEREFSMNESSSVANYSAPSHQATSLIDVLYEVYKPSSVMFTEGPATSLPLPLSLSFALRDSSIRK